MKKDSISVRNIWMVTREYGNLAGAGGVKDVTAQLASALAAWTGRKVSVVMPCYGFMDPQSHNFQPLQHNDAKDQPMTFQVDMNYVGEERRETLQVWQARLERVNVYLLDSPRFREKDAVYTYTAKEEEIDPFKRQGEGHYDYFAVNLLLQKGALQLMLQLQERPDIIHCHDGHTAVLPAIIHETPWLATYFKNTGCLVTVHNAGMGYHQDVDDLPFAHALTGLPWRTIMAGRLGESFNPLITASLYATLNTVSENYARELQESVDDAQTGWLGHRLVEMGKKLEGITNGIDPNAFDPKKGKELGLAASFDPLKSEALQGKELCKKALREELAKDGPAGNVHKHGFLQEDLQFPLLTFIGRLSTQKGVDILIQAALAMLEQQVNTQLVVLGSGSAELESQLKTLVESDQGRGRICFLSGYDLTLANRVYSAGDFFLIPSRYEPCGLTDFIAQLFGNIPIVHQVGGLVKVIDGKTGFGYSSNTAASLLKAIQRAVAVKNNDPQLLKNMQRQAVQTILATYSWKRVKDRYITLYKQAIAQKDEMAGIII